VLHRGERDLPVAPRREQRGQLREIRIVPAAETIPRSDGAGAEELGPRAVDGCGGKKVRPDDVTNQDRDAEFGRTVRPVALAREILLRYAELKTGPRIAFFETLATRFSPDRVRLETAVTAWLATTTDAAAAEEAHRAATVAEWTNRARDLANAPPNELTPERLAERAAQVAEGSPQLSSESFGLDRIVSGVQFDFVAYGFPATIPQMTFQRLL